jgi:predicted dehydrogenase
MFGWGIVSTGKHPDIKIAPAMAAADGGELVGVYSRDQHRAEGFAQKYPEALLPNYVAEIEDFQRAVATGGQPAATGLDGLRVVEVTLAMIESARTRRSVKIERVEP